MFNCNQQMPLRIRTRAAVKIRRRKWGIRITLLVRMPRTTQPLITLQSLGVKTVQVLQIILVVVFLVTTQIRMLDIRSKDIAWSRATVSTHHRSSKVRLHSMRTTRINQNRSSLGEPSKIICSSSQIRWSLPRAVILEASNQCNI